jgi:hypothetical protein
MSPCFESWGKILHPLSICGLNPRGPTSYTSCAKRIREENRTRRLWFKGIVLWKKYFLLSKRRIGQVVFASKGQCHERNSFLLSKRRIGQVVFYTKGQYQCLLLSKRRIGQSSLIQRDSVMRWIVFAIKQEIRTGCLWLKGIVTWDKYFC